MRPLLLSTALSLFFLLAGCGNSTPESKTTSPADKGWISFNALDCGFSIWMPVAPQQKNSFVHSAAGRAEIKTFFVEAEKSGDASAYSVVCAQFPRGLLSKFEAEPYAFLERTYEGRSKSTKRELVYNKRIESDKLRGIEVQHKRVGASSTIVTTSRYFLAGDRTYLVSINASSKAVEEGHPALYLDSFQVTR